MARTRYIILRHSLFNLFLKPTVYGKRHQLGHCALLAIFGSIMVSLRRRKLLGLCSGKSSFVAPLPRTSENGNAPENSTQNIRPISLRPSSLDNVSLQRGGYLSNAESDIGGSKFKTRNRV
ncbi:hypothetical protein CUMW_049150 [Citrus unshiu]|nr:hypothetical protein CUMW_049150 [Citrus unshiu]